MLVALSAQLVNGGCTYGHCRCFSNGGPNGRSSSLLPLSFLGELTRISFDDLPRSSTDPVVAENMSSLPDSRASALTRSQTRSHRQPLFCSLLAMYVDDSLAGCNPRSFLNPIKVSLLDPTVRYPCGNLRIGWMALIPSLSLLISPVRRCFRLKLVGIPKFGVCELSHAH